MPTPPALTITRSRIYNDIAVNLHDRFWILRDGEDRDIYTVDPDNRWDDITIGERVQTVWSAEDVVEHCGHSLNIDDATKNTLLNLFA